MRYKHDRVQQLVQADLDGLSQFENLHGINAANLREHVVPLRHESFVSVGPPEKLIGLWIVLDEVPNTDKGYLVVYCPRRQMYGLALKRSSKRRPALVGFYGSLKDTLEGM